MTKRQYLNQTRDEEDLEQYVQEYATPDSARRVDQTILHFLAESVVPQLEGPNVLECGYGDGQWTDLIIHRFGKSHIVDASAELIKTATDNFGDRVTAFESFFEEFEPKERFDSVICTYVLEHVVDPVEVLAQCRSWLRQNGLLYVAVPNAQSLHRHLGVVMGLQKKPDDFSETDFRMGHRRVYDAASMEVDIATAGLKVERACPTMCKPLPNSAMTHLSNEQLHGLFMLGEHLPPESRGILAYFCRPSD